MANEILKGVAKGINEGVNKSPFPNPVGTVAGGIGGIKSGLKGFRKKQQAEQKKVVSAEAKKAKVANQNSKKIDKVKTKFGNPKITNKLIEKPQVPNIGGGKVNVDSAIKNYKRQQAIKNKKTGPLLVNNNFEEAIKKKLGL